MDATGKTGIEIAAGISDATRATEKLLHAVHLDWFGAAIKSLAKGATMSISVDGIKRQEPWSGVTWRSNFLRLPGANACATTGSVVAIASATHDVAAVGLLHALGWRRPRGAACDATVRLSSAR